MYYKQNKNAEQISTTANKLDSERSARPSEVNRFPFKTNIGDLQINDILAAKPCRINQGHDDTLFQEGWGCPEFFEFAVVQDNRQFGVSLERRQGDRIFIHPQKPAVISKSVNHVFKTAS